MKSWGDTVLGDAEQMLREGRIGEARPLLVAYVQKDPSSARAWWLLSMALSDPKQQIDCLERVLRIDPNNAPARTRLSKLRGEAPPRPISVSFETSPPVRQEAPHKFSTVPPEVQEPLEPKHPAVKKKANWVVPVSILMVCLCAAVGIIVLLGIRQRVALPFISQPTQAPSLPSETVPALGLPPTWTATITYTAPPTRTLIASLSTPDLITTLTATDIPSSNVGLAPGTDAPDFTLKDVANGKQTSLSDYRGHPVIIFFFWAAASCNYCAYEAPALQKIYEDYGDAGLVVLGIDGSGFGAGGEDAGGELARAFRDKYSLTFPILNGWEAIVFRQYKGTGFPINYFVDSKGKISSSSFGALDYSSLNIRVRVMLNLIPTAIP